MTKPSSDRDHLDVYIDGAGAHRWHRVAGNGEVIAQGEAHTTATDAERAARRACPDVEDVRHLGVLRTFGASE